MKSRQVSAARALLGWSPEQLAQKSNVPVSSVYLLIRLGSAGPEHDHLMRAAFEREGIHFSEYRWATSVGIGGEINPYTGANDLVAAHSMIF